MMTTTTTTTQRHRDQMRLHGADCCCCVGGGDVESCGARRLDPGLVVDHCCSNYRQHVDHLAGHYDGGGVALPTIGCVAVAVHAAEDTGVAAAAGKQLAAVVEQHADGDGAGTPGTGRMAVAAEARDDRGMTLGVHNVVVVVVVDNLAAAAAAAAAVDQRFEGHQKTPAGHQHQHQRFHPDATELP